ncbi:hypothetical protein NVV95_16755 [Herbiconiux sp. CPCC 205716]|uniref:DUF2029 domain-containing protein n=1 Tax=Herbiconiux gentiana TaxID=2970912 RepID=A0ABT2GIZ4_9MICO|nr:hypothetical protein [Herbiconiux gentiana]MCS5716199.1 hypothetical protein [Herbiconiux gentiana]
MPLSRARAATWVFGPEAGRVSPFPARAGAVTALFVVGTAVAALRLPDGQRNVLWSEDGNQFLEGAFAHDYLTNLVTPYAGYMHFLPRTAAQLVEAVVPTTQLGTGMNLAGAMVWAAAAVAAFVFTRDRVQRPLRLLLWLLVLIVPIGSLEVATNVANSHWFLIFALFLALSARSGPGVGRLLFGSVLVAAAVMSDPLAIAFAPLVLARAVLLPRLRENVVGIVFAAAAVVQVLVVLGTERDRGEPELEPAAMAATYLVRVVFGDLLGHTTGSAVYDTLGRHPVVLIAAAVVALLVLLIALRLGRDGLPALALAASAAFFTVTAVLTWASLGAPAPGQEVFRAGRYLVVPSLLLIVSTVSATSAWLPGPDARGGRRVARIVGVAIVAAALIAPGVVDYRSPDNKAGVPELTESVPTFRAECEADPAAEVRVPIGPAGYWFLVPCDRILHE